MSWLMLDSTGGLAQQPPPKNIGKKSAPAVRIETELSE